MGTLIGAQFGKFITTNLNQKDSDLHFWTDSMIAFHWIRSSSKQWNLLTEGSIHLARFFRTFDQKGTKVKHSGLQATLNQLREIYWILRGRQMTKKCIQRCLFCKQAQIKAGQQVRALLSKERTNTVHTLETTGKDFSGPLYVQPHNSKAYIALFTCTVTRTVHLELVSDLSTDAFLLALGRFIA